MRRCAAVLVAAIAAAAMVPAAPVRAQAPPTLPELPPEAAWAVELLGPGLSPACEASAVVGFFGPALLGSAPPEVVELVTSIGPSLVILCGAIPVETGGYECELDGDLAVATSELLTPIDPTIASLALTALPQPVATLMNQTRNLQGFLDGLLPGAPAEPTIAGMLQCVQPLEDLPVDAEPAPPVDPVEPADPAPPPAVATPVAVPSPIRGPVLSFTPLPAPAPPVPAAPAAPTATLPTAPVVAAPVVTYGFQYPAVLLVPLALLAGGAVAGRSLTRELAPRRQPDV